jgi:hypothetical protein
MLIIVFTEFKRKNEPVSQASSKFIREVNKLYGSNELFLAKNSLSVSIDFTRVIPERSLRYMGNPIIHAIILGIILLISTSFVMIGISNLIAFNADVFILVAAIILFIIGSVFASLFEGIGKFSSTLFNLGVQPYVLIVIDNRLVLIQSGWIRTEGLITLNDGNSQFSVIEVEQSIGIGWKAVGSGETIPIFLIPKSFLQLFFPDQKLNILYNNLNRLLRKAKEFNELDINLSVTEQHGAPIL